MGRNLIIGDIHGMYDRMLSVLDKASFKAEEDTLYSVGDFCDRGDKPLQVLSYLMGLPHFLPVAGNHDLWLYGFLRGKGAPEIWLDPRNGGMKTYEVLNSLGYGMRWKICKWLGSMPFVRFTEDKIILHAGIPQSVTDETQLESLFEDVTLKNAFDSRIGNTYNPLVHDIVWDRTYIMAENRQPFKTDKTIICGHTPLTSVFYNKEFHIKCIDTGSFVPSGHITVMDMDSGELFLS
ncbi:MAG: metallophosphoesterase [Sphaerochaetaceae bacterium]|nr:metallophosphoesterase [Sphaerochaetaceae bacterium]